MSVDEQKMDCVDRDSDYRNIIDSVTFVHRHSCEVERRVHQQRQDAEEKCDSGKIHRTSDPGNIFLHFEALVKHAAAEMWYKGVPSVPTTGIGHSSVAGSPPKGSGQLSRTNNDGNSPLDQGARIGGRSRRRDTRPIPNQQRGQMELSRSRSRNRLSAHSKRRTTASSNLPQSDHEEEAATSHPSHHHPSATPSSSSHNVEREEEVRPKFADKSKPDGSSLVVTNESNEPESIVHFSTIQTECIGYPVPAVKLPLLEMRVVKSSLRQLPPFWYQIFAQQEGPSLQVHPMQKTYRTLLSQATLMSRLIEWAEHFIDEKKVDRNNEKLQQEIVLLSRYLWGTIGSDRILNWFRANGLILWCPLLAAIVRLHPFTEHNLAPRLELWFKDYELEKLSAEDLLKSGTTLRIRKMLEKCHTRSIEMLPIGYEVREWFAPHAPSELQKFEEQLRRNRALSKMETDDERHNIITEEDSKMNVPAASAPQTVTTQPPSAEHATYCNPEAIQWGFKMSELPTGIQPGATSQAASKLLKERSSLLYLWSHDGNFKISTRVWRNFKHPSVDRPYWSKHDKQQGDDQQYNNKSNKTINIPSICLLEFVARDPCETDPEKWREQCPTHILWIICEYIKFELESGIQDQSKSSKVIWLSFLRDEISHRGLKIWWMRSPMAQKVNWNAAQSSSFVGEVWRWLNVVMSAFNWAIHDESDPILTDTPIFPELRHYSDRIHTVVTASPSLQKGDFWKLWKCGTIELCQMMENPPNNSALFGLIPVICNCPMIMSTLTERESLFLLQLIPDFQFGSDAHDPTIKLKAARNVLFHVANGLVNYFQKRAVEEKGNKKIIYQKILQEESSAWQRLQSEYELRVDDGIHSSENWENIGHDSDGLDEIVSSSPNMDAFQENLVNLNDVRRKKKPLPEHIIDDIYDDETYEPEHCDNVRREEDDDNHNRRQSTASVPPYNQPIALAAVPAAALPSSAEPNPPINENLDQEMTDEAMQENEGVQLNSDEEIHSNHSRKKDRKKRRDRKKSRKKDRKEKRKRHRNKQMPFKTSYDRAKGRNPEKVEDKITHVPQMRRTKDCWGNPNPPKWTDEGPYILQSPPTFSQRMMDTLMPKRMDFSGKSITRSQLSSYKDILNVSYHWKYHKTSELLPLGIKWKSKPISREKGDDWVLTECAAQAAIDADNRRPATLMNLWKDLRTLGTGTANASVNQAWYMAYIGIFYESRVPNVSMADLQRRGIRFEYYKWDISTRFLSAPLNFVRFGGGKKNICIPQHNACLAEILGHYLTTFTLNGLQMHIDSDVKDGHKFRIYLKPQKSVYLMCSRCFGLAKGETERKAKKKKDSDPQWNQKSHAFCQECHRLRSGTPYKKVHNFSNVQDHPKGSHLALWFAVTLFVCKIIHETKRLPGEEVKDWGVRILEAVRKYYDVDPLVHPDEAVWPVSHEEAWDKKKKFWKSRSESVEEAFSWSAPSGRSKKKKKNNAPWDATPLFVNDLQYLVENANRFFTATKSVQHDYCRLYHKQERYRWDTKRLMKVQYYFKINNRRLLYDSLSEEMGNLKWNLKKVNPNYGVSSSDQSDSSLQNESEMMGSRHAVHQNDSNGDTVTDDDDQIAENQDDHRVNQQNDSAVSDDDDEIPANMPLPMQSSGVQSTANASPPNPNADQMEQEDDSAVSDDGDVDEQDDSAVPDDGDVDEQDEQIQENEPLPMQSSSTQSSAESAPHHTSTDWSSDGDVIQASGDDDDIQLSSQNDEVEDLKQEDEGGPLSPSPELEIVPNPKRRKLSHQPTMPMYAAGKVPKSLLRKRKQSPRKVKESCKSAAKKVMKRRDDEDDDRDSHKKSDRDRSRGRTAGSNTAPSRSAVTKKTNSRRSNKSHKGRRVNSMAIQQMLEQTVVTAPRKHFPHSAQTETRIRCSSLKTRRVSQQRWTEQAADIEFKIQYQCQQERMTMSTIKIPQKNTPVLPLESLSDQITTPEPEPVEKPPPRRRRKTDDWKGGLELSPTTQRITQDVHLTRKKLREMKNALIPLDIKIKGSASFPIMNDSEEYCIGGGVVFTEKPPGTKCLETIMLHRHGPCPPESKRNTILFDVHDSEFGRRCKHLLYLFRWIRWIVITNDRNARWNQTSRSKLHQRCGVDLKLVFLRPNHQNYVLDPHKTLIFPHLSVPIRPYDDKSVAELIAMCHTNIPIPHLSVSMNGSQSIAPLLASNALDDRNGCWDYVIGVPELLIMSRIGRINETIAPWARKSLLETDSSFMRECTAYPTRLEKIINDHKRTPDVHSQYHRFDEADLSDIGRLLRVTKPCPKWWAYGSAKSMAEHHLSIVPWPLRSVRKINQSYKHFANGELLQYVICDVQTWILFTRQHTPEWFNRFIVLLTKVKWPWKKREMKITRVSDAYCLTPATISYLFFTSSHHILGSWFYGSYQQDIRKMILLALALWQRMINLILLECVPEVRTGTSPIQWNSVLAGTDGPHFSWHDPYRCQGKTDDKLEPHPIHIKLDVYKIYPPETAKSVTRSRIKGISRHSAKRRMHTDKGNHKVASNTALARRMTQKQKERCRQRKRHLPAARDRRNRNPQTVIDLTADSQVQDWNFKKNKSQLGIPSIFYTRWQSSYLHNFPHNATAGHQERKDLLVAQLTSFAEDSDDRDRYHFAETLSSVFPGPKSIVYTVLSFLPSFQKPTAKAWMSTNRPSFNRDRFLYGY